MSHTPTTFATPATVSRVVEASRLRRDEPWWARQGCTLFCGDSIEIMRSMPARSFDLIFADPPYFLSGAGSTCSGGQRTPVHKGTWDEPRTPDEMHAFNRAWLGQAQRLLDDDGVIWVSGTHHVIHSVGFAMQQLGLKTVNDVVWEKPNPPPNLGCRSLTHSHETIIWAKKTERSRHHFDYPRMKRITGVQLRDVWRIPPPSRSERARGGGHPTQKPMALVDRIVRASCPRGGRVLDPFNGSGTTAEVAHLRRLEFTGIDRVPRWLEVTRDRVEDCAA